MAACSPRLVYACLCSSLVSFDHVLTTSPATNLIATHAAKCTEVPEIMVVIRPVCSGIQLLRIMFILTALSKQARLFGGRQNCVNQPLYNTSYLSSLEAELLRLGAIQIHVCFTLRIYCQAY